MKLNLHKAQKLITKLNQEIKGLSFNSVGTLLIDVSDNSDYILNNLKKHISAENEEIEKFLILSKDLNKLKSLVFLSNIKNGTHNLLVELNHKRKLVSIYKNLLTNIKRSSDIRSADYITKEFIENKQSILKDANNTATRVNYAIFDDVNLEKELKELSKEIDSLEDKLAKNNVSTEIEIEFELETKSILNIE